MYRLSDATGYTYLTTGGITTVDALDDAQEFATVREALASVGIPEAKQADVWRVLAAILHLGNVEFVDGPGGDCSFIVNTVEAAAAAEFLGTPALPDKLVRSNTPGRVWATRCQKCVPPR